MKKILLQLMLILIASGGFAQRMDKIDSLKQELNKFEDFKRETGNKTASLADSIEANMLYGIVKASWSAFPDSAMIYAQNCLLLSQNIGYKRGVGNACNSIGFISSIKGDNARALEYYQKALKVRTEIEDREGLGWTYNNMGLLYGAEGNYAAEIMSHSNAIKIRTGFGDKDNLEDSYLKRAREYEVIGDYPNALKDDLSALKITEETGSSRHVIGIYSGIGSVYNKMGDYAEALKYYLKSSKLSVANGEVEEIINASNNLGDMFFKRGDYNNALKNYQAALNACVKFKGSPYAYVNFYCKKARTFLKMENYAEALNNCMLALDTAKKIKDKNGTAIAYSILGDAYKKQGDLQKALQYESRCLLVATEIKANDLKKSTYEDLAEINRGLGNYKAAYDNEVLFKQYYDTIFNSENEKKLTASLMQYEFGKQQDSLKAEQDKKDLLQVAQVKQQKQQKSIFILVVLMMLLVAGVLLNRLLYSRKTQKQLAGKNVEIEKQKLRAEQSEKFKEQFLANMSHEIRTPMNAVLGMTNLVLDTPLNEKQKKYLVAVKKSSENLLVILNDILDLSKLEAGKMELEKLPFQLAEQVNQAMDIMRFKAEEKGLLFTCEIADTVPEVVIGDAPRLNQILINLLSNAIKFTDRGFVKLEVLVMKPQTQIPDSTIQPGLLEFKITDSGVGITDKQQTKIFESFTQAESNTSRKYGGTGLGLAISKTLVELQGGRIEVKSEIGRGSEFSFTIRYPVGVAKDIPTAKGVFETDYSDLAKLKLLVAEDYEFNQIVIKDTLEQLLPGITVEIAANGKIAVEKVEKGHYDMVLMDVQMPEMDGYEATRFIRNTLKMDIPIIALTASVIRSDLDKCMQAGMNGYIPKPFEREELLNELMKHKPVLI